MKFLLILLLSAMILPVYAEEYYYFEDHKLSSPPEFCIIEFADPQLPGAEDKLYAITQSAIEEWENKLVRFTGEKLGWDFTYKIISQQRYDDFFSEDVCDVTIYYEREPTTVEEFSTAGHTYAEFGLADITIFYLEPVWIYSGQIEIIEGEEYEIAEISHFKNSLDPYNDETIKHEIGHALGLDHYPAETSEITELNGVYSAPSIMTLSDDDYLVDRMVITDYDIRSLVNLYGQDGINAAESGVFWDFTFVAIVILIIVYFLRKKFPKKKFTSIPYEENSETKKCIRCKKLIPSTQGNVCDTCLQKNGFGA